MVEKQGVPFVDLLPSVENLDPASLWVTVPDPHPNAKAEITFAKAMLPRLTAMLDKLCREQGKGCDRLVTTNCRRRRRAGKAGPACQERACCWLHRSSSASSLPRAAVRFIDGYGMSSWPLSEPGAAQRREGRRDGPDAARAPASTAPGSSPIRRRCPTARETPADWRKLFHAIEANPVGGMTFRPIDEFKAWNTAFVGDPCTNRILHYAPGQLCGLPPEGRRAGAALPLPARRHPARPVSSPTRSAGAARRSRSRVARRTVRIVFVGSSTTVDAHHLPFSWPEFVGH